jgi:uncharacterized protein DUF4349
MRARRATTATALTAVSLIAAATVLAGCGGTNNGSTSSDTGGGTAGQRAPSAAEPSKGASQDDGYTSGGGSGTHTSARVVPITRSVVYRGEITVRVKNVAAAVARAEGFATGVDGLIYAEETSTDPGRRQASQATMSLKVPPSQFRPVLNQLGGLGKQLSRSQTAEDVTSQAVDIESRLRSQRSSVARLQTLLTKATTVGAIVQVEGELSQREADLEALEAQQKKLSELVDLATISVSFVAPDAKVAPVKTDDNLGFMSGLRGGLNALLVVVVVGLTAAGALLPFLITLELIGVPALLVLRSRRHATPSVAPAGSDS